MSYVLYFKRHLGRTIMLAAALTLAALLGAVAPARAMQKTAALSSSCTELPDGLTSWWPADGTAEDFQGNHDGALEHGADYDEGVIGKGFAFDGRDDYVRLPDNFFPYPQTGDGTEPFSFSVWFKTTRNGVILGQHLSNGRPEDDSHPIGWSPAIYVGTDGYLYVEMFWGAAPVPSAARVDDGDFHHVAVTYEGPVNSLQKVYLDGVLINERERTQVGYVRPDTVYKYQLGTGYTRNREGTNGRWFFFTGTIDEPQLYNRVLTAEEVRSLFEARDGGYCSFVISGRVTNVCGDAVPGTPITLSYADSSKSVPVPARTAFTNADGFYRFDRVGRGLNYVLHPPAEVPHTPAKYFIENLGGNRTADFTDLTPVLWCPTPL